MKNRKTVLITGACGFIGAYLIRHLPEYDIVAYDNFLKQRYCSLLNLPPNVQFIESSFIDIPQRVLTDIDAVLHLGSLTNAVESMESELIFENLNVKLTRAFILKCKAAKIPLFIFPSSCSVYGYSTNEVFEDQSKFINCQSIYAQTKIDIEQLLSFYKDDNYKYLITRFGTVYGSQSLGIRYECAIPRASYNAQFGIKIPIWRESYKLKRPYLSLQDLTQALKILLSNEEYWNQTYNIVSTHKTYEEILDYIREIVGEIKEDWVDTPMLNTMSYLVNCDKIKKLGYIPHDDVKEEIRKTIQLLGPEGKDLTHELF